MMEIRQDNDFTDRVGASYTESDTEILWPIEPSVDYVVFVTVGTRVD